MHRAENHYKVVRYTPHFGHGLIEILLGEHLSLEGAQRLADLNPPLSREEGVVIRDEEKMGLEGEIETRTYVDDGSDS